jgi:ABC-type lipoprotein export system ATPase subunit
MIPHSHAAVFDARALTKVYHMGEVSVQALRGVDFTLLPREFVVLLGSSGSGKSTLLNILGGLDVPTSGAVVYKDHDLTAATEAELTEYRRTHVGFVFQFYNLIPSLTARENVALVTDIVERPMAAEEALAMVGLEHRLDISRRSSRAASSSVSPLRARSRSGPTCCCATNRRALSTLPPASSCSRRSRRSIGSSARRPW